MVLRMALAAGSCACVVAAGDWTPRRAALQGLSARGPRGR